MSILLTLDPGGTTGWSTWGLFDDRPIELISWGQIPGGVDGVIASYGFIREADVLVSESFVLDGRTPKPDVTALRIEGVLKLISAQSGAQLIFQRNAYKAHAPDELLKRVGLWKPGQQHARDAMRHAIAFAKTKGHRPTIQKLWPVPDGI